MSMKSTSIKEFLKRKNVNITVQTYLIDALGAMAVSYTHLPSVRVIPSVKVVPSTKEKGE